MAAGARAPGEWQWQNLAVVLDSPLAADLTAGYSRNACSLIATKLHFKV
ncbi:MAG: hypothetical protein ACNA7T_12650 [Haliea sp.]